MSSDASGDRERAAILAHELQHAIDHAAGKIATSGPGCFTNEEDAFRTEGRVWAELWANQLPTETSSVGAELNDIALATSRDPDRLAAGYLANYAHECG